MNEVMALIGRVDAARSALKQLGEQAGRAMRHQAAVLAAPPHTADIVAGLQARLDSIATTFEAQVVSYPATLAAGLDDATGAAVIAYLYRDMIASKLPSVIERLRPEAKTGMTPEQRADELAKVGEELSRLWRERDALRQRLGAEKIAMRDLRQQAMWDRDAKARGLIETLEMDLTPEMEALRADQDRLHVASLVRR